MLQPMQDKPYEDICTCKQCMMGIQPSVQVQPSVEVIVLNKIKLKFAFDQNYNLQIVVSLIICIVFHLVTVLIKPTLSISRAHHNLYTCL